MKKLGNIISEITPLLSLYLDEDNTLMMKAFSKKYKGNFCFSVNFSDLLAYFESKITLEELIGISNNFYFLFDKGQEMIKIPIDDVINSLEYRSVYFNQVPNSRK